MATRDQRRKAASQPVDTGKSAAVSPGNGAGRRPATTIFRPQSLQRGAVEGGFQFELGSKVAQLVDAYRSFGHLAAWLNPLATAPPLPPQLEPGALGLDERDFARGVQTQLAGRRWQGTCGELVDLLQQVYCGTVGYEYMHLVDAAVRSWLEQRIEGGAGTGQLSDDRRRQVLREIVAADVFEEFVRKKYIGTKTYALAGSEFLTPLLQEMIFTAADQGVDEVILGMAHRGRLNVLVNVLQKPAEELFCEFEDPPVDKSIDSGDVKHHKGFSSDLTGPDGQKVHLSLCFNPSHLEFVDPVVVGRTRAKQDRFEDRARRKGLSVIVHGDASFAGEGIVQETMNLALLDGYQVGGTLHIVVNNQIGFTTTAAEGRSQRYATETAKSEHIPVFHVNGDDLDAVIRMLQLAMEFRAEFQRDVILDVYCYRRLGHNEVDEPSFTQPVMYRQIENHPPVRQLYGRKLIDEGLCSEEEIESWAQERQQALSESLDRVREENGCDSDGTEQPAGVWKGYQGGPQPQAAEEPETGVPKQTLVELLEKLVEVPADFRLQKKLQRFYKARREMADQERPIDWSTAEALALATLAVEGHPVRLSGQDTVRGTFTQRHGMVFDREDGQAYRPFAHLAPDQAPVEIINSPLCEAGAVGYEYGYSLDRPEALVAWEAQFGDFSNAAEVYFDQFLSSGEEKWGRLSGLVLLLPHGFEGQGPEHSSARLERVLTLAADDNWQLVYPSTAAQYFHVLRRQVVRTWRKPLVVLTPKGLLRSPDVFSPLDDLAGGRFERVLPDPATPGEKTRRVLLCSGKVYHELAAERDEREAADIMIVRLEQIYPLPLPELEEALTQVAGDTPIYWVQEEPENMGAWRFLWATTGPRLLDRFPLGLIARQAAASPATGWPQRHKKTQHELIERALSE